MKFIVIILAFLAEQHLGPLERLRKWQWLQLLGDKLHAVFGNGRVWGGPLGVIATIALILALVHAPLGYLAEHLWLIWALTQLIILLYCLGPRDLGHEIDAHVRGLAGGDPAQLEASTRALTDSHVAPPPEQRPQAVLEGIFSAASERLFGVYVWFALFGALGAILFRAAAELRVVSASRTHGYTQAASQLYAVLNWLPVRLFALGFALAGSLTHTFDRWSFRQTLHADENDNLIRAAGLGAVQFDRAGQALSPEEERDWVEQARGLIGRTFCVWLTVLGLMTLAGWFV
ncbi:MAG: cobalamin biosynthesis protein [Chromatiales bacterium]